MKELKMNRKSKLVGDVNSEIYQPFKYEETGTKYVNANTSYTARA